MNQDKVKLPKRIAEPLENMRAKGMQSFAIVRNHIENCHIEVNGWENLQYMNPDDLIRALYVGYEVEQTPEEKVKDYYDSQKYHIDEDHAEYAIRNVLDILNIKIEGVNK